MNILQNLKTEETILVTLNDNGNINPKKVLKKITYEHPLFSLEQDLQVHIGVMASMKME